jgi:hypothetical protein
MAYGKQAARNIDRQLMEADRWESILPHIEYSQEPPAEPSDCRRHVCPEIAAELRARSEVEVVTGLTPEDAHDESCRCLRCDIKVVTLM